MNFLKGEPIQMKGSMEKWRGEAEVSSLAPKKGNKADTTQGFSHHAQVLLPAPLSSGDQGARSTPTARRRGDHLQHQIEKEPGPGERWEGQTERCWPKSGVVPVLEKGLQLSDMLGKRSLLWGGSLQQLLPPSKKEKKKQPH